MRAVAVALALVGCSDNKTTSESQPVPVAVREKPAAPEPVRPVEPAKPVEPPRPVEPPKAFAIDRLKVTSGVVETILEDVDRVLKETAPELVMMKYAASYVRKDGSLDPAYGKLDVELQTTDSVDGVIDDPNRPTGAPLPDVAPAEKLRTRCPTLRLEKGAWTVRETSCYKTRLKVGPKCTVAQIWSKALAAGAPDNALALVDLDRRGSGWNFRVIDKLRGVDFHKHVNDDECTPKPPKPNPYQDRTDTPPPPPAKGKPNPFN